MKIIITSATNFELNVAQQKIKSTKNKHIIFATTGIGMLATAVNLSKIIYEQQPNFIIQAGIAGCFNQTIPLGKTFIIDEEYLGDLGVEENGIWKDVFDLKIEKQNAEPFKKRGLINNKIHEYNFLNLPIVTAITVNQISTDKNHIQQLIEKYKPTIESMEGAALHYVCNIYKIPYLQIRAISNYVGERDKTKWKMKLAIDNLNKYLVKNIVHLTS